MSSDKAPQNYIASHLKDMNRKKVFNLLASAGEVSRAEISRRTKISAPTVLKIAEFLLSNGFVVEAGAGDSALGRKPRILRFDPGCRHSIGVEFEGDYLKLGMVDLAGRLSGFTQIQVGRDFETILRNDLLPALRGLIASMGVSISSVLGVGMGIPGVVDADRLVLEFAPLVGVHSPKDCTRLIRDLSAELAMPVFIENDVNAAALGEYTTRKLGRHGELVYVTAGTGLGAGVILNGSIRKGRHNSAGEIGYMVFEPGFESSKSRPGWLESRVSLQTLQSREPRFSPEGSGKLGAEGSPPLTTELIEGLAADLALCIANFTCLIDIDLVVLGGITAKLAGPSLLAAVNRHLARLSVVNVQCEEQRCSESGVVGAAIIASNAMIDRLLLG